jgi:cathepsin E
MKVKDRRRLLGVAWVICAASFQASVSLPIDDEFTYIIVEVGVGSPTRDFTLLADTGSSNTWVGAQKSYQESETSKETGNHVSVSYSSGEFSGTEYTDTWLMGGVEVTEQFIGVATKSEGFPDT